MSRGRLCDLLRSRQQVQKPCGAASEAAGRRPIPAEDFRVKIRALNEVVNFEIYCQVRTTPCGHGRHPGDVGSAMMFVYRDQRISRIRIPLAHIALQPA